VFMDKTFPPLQPSHNTVLLHLQHPMKNTLC
jgi:hypothetical protein